jgi:hypothetical protein
VHGSTTGDVSPTTTRTDLLSEWPITGSLRFETNTPNQEVIAYTSRVLLPGNQNIEFQLAAPMALIHGQFSPLELVITSNPGLGDSTDPGQPSLTPYADVGVIGGRMADVRE